MPQPARQRVANPRQGDFAKPDSEKKRVSGGSPSGRTRLGAADQRCRAAADRLDEMVEPGVAVAGNYQIAAITAQRLRGFSTPRCDYLKINPTAPIPTLIDPDGPGGQPLSLIQSWAMLYYLAEKTGRLIPSDMAPTAQNIFFLGNRMPERVPASAIKFYEGTASSPSSAPQTSSSPARPISLEVRSPLPISACIRSLCRTQSVDRQRRPQKRHRLG